MKVSEITTELVADHLRLDYANMASDEKAALSVMLDTAIAFVKSYTGIINKAISNEIFGYGDGETTSFNLAYAVIDAPTIYTGTNATTDFTFHFPSEIIFDTAPDNGVELSADYETGLDAHDDIVIAVYVLCQDMYDTRSYYVDKSNVNKVVETILNMHCINLL